MPKIVDHDRYREELVAGCLSLFAERGYASLTMRDIAKALSVSTGTLYHYFPSKEALFEAVVQCACQQDVGAAANALAEAPATPRQRLAALFKHVAANEQRFAQEQLVLLEFRQIHGRNAPALEAANQAGETYIAALDAILGIEDPALARTILLLIDGLLFKRLFDPVRNSFEAQAEVIARLLPPEPAVRKIRHAR